MVKFRPFLTGFTFPNFKLKFKLGALLLSLSFFLNYQPGFAFPPKSNLVYAEIAQESSVSGGNLGMSFQLPYDGYITTPFSSYHPGIDICAGLGFPIKPIAKGTVVNTGYNFFGLGLVVEVDHGNGYRSLYAHLGKIYTEAGKEVNENSFIGEIGLTGNTSGPHTHLEVSKDGVKIDPRLILPPIRNYPKEEDFVAVKSATPSAVTIPASAPPSASFKPAPTILPSTNPVPQIDNGILKEIVPSERIEEVKTDLKQQQIKNVLIENVLNLASPNPSASPLPQGGRISLKNLPFLGLGNSLIFFLN